MSLSSWMVIFRCQSDDGRWGFGLSGGSGGCIPSHFFASWRGGYVSIGDVYSGSGEVVRANVGPVVGVRL